MVVTIKKFVNMVFEVFGSPKKKFKVLRFELADTIKKAGN